MKPSKSSGFFKPFNNLDTLIEGKEIKLKPAPVLVKKEAKSRQMNHWQEQAIFNDAMADVKRISRTNCPAVSLSKLKPQTLKPNLEYESVQKLRNLVSSGAGFVVSLTPEYIEGIPDWTQGFSYITLIGKRPHVEPIAIISGSYIFGGKQYKK